MSVLRRPAPLPASPRREGGRQRSGASGRVDRSLVTEDFPLLRSAEDGLSHVLAMA